ncbi:rod shape-determining protein RodA [Sphingomonas sp. ID0503]|uniref:rod shape-determining protein RodA n=1 Tax=Sphingomonas sp. ID0503 TaxID=3399691 RepID=UPI003AFB3A95
MIVPRILAEIRWRIVFLLLAIAGFGLVVLYSAAGGSMRPWAASQGTRLIAFLIMALVLSRFPERFWKAIAFPSWAVLVFLLLLIDAVGAVAGGAQRWLDLGIIRLQPSEMMKLSVVLTLARFYDLLPASETRRLTAIWPAALFIGVPFVLVMLQPDLGTSLMIVFGGVVTAFLAGLPLRLFLGAAAGVAALLPIAFTMMHDYQRNRVLIFLDPESDPLGTGYHISQSKIAIGSGGLFGKGFLNGTQSHLDYLPEGHTDFVFATMAEEWGLAGGLFLIGGFLALMWWALRVALRADSRFGRLTAGGLSATIFFYVAINLMMVMGLAPVVGIPLPMVSFGGSAMMTMMIVVGILMSIDRSSRMRPAY